MNRLLVVDDDIELCSLVTKYLELEGFEVKTVNEGEQGMELALSGKYALVILDVMLSTTMRRIVGAVDLLL